MDVPISFNYRISSHGGVLFVRDSLLGEIIGRFPSSRSTLVAIEAEAIVAQCISVFRGKVESIERDHDVVHVTCKIEPK